MLYIEKGDMQGFMNIMKERIPIQDTLKYLVQCEYDGLTAQPESLSNVLAIVPEQMDRVLRDLESAELVYRDKGMLLLTPSGREYALHVLRAHRLYETYLAEKAGVSDDRLHAQAEIEEHKLSADDVEKLARELDHPRYDPHGDPIPTATGEMPPKRGQPLSDYPAGWEGRVIHIEDEPPALYAHIYAANIAPGTVLRIAEKGDEKLRVQTEGCSYHFPTDVASQITVVPLEQDEAFDESLQRLSSLVQGEEASVVGLSPLCRGLERNRLLDLGVVPGSSISVDMVSPSGSPIAYRIRGASIALRRQQSDLVLIRKTEDEANG